MSTALQQVASRLSVSPEELQSIVINTVMPSGGKQVTNDEFVSFMVVANEYKLNPLIKEIYALLAKGGGIQPIVSIDGWLKIINTHAEFDGMTHEDVRDSNGDVIAITCSIYKKNTKHPVTVTEYMSECKGNTDPWKRWPIRMLRHKATIQCARYAFGISGIVDPDEVERMKDVGAIVEKDITPVEVISDEQKEHLKQVISDAGITEADLCNIAKIDCIDNLPADRLQGAVNYILSNAGEEQ